MESYQNTTELQNLCHTEILRTKDHIIKTNEFSLSKNSKKRCFPKEEAHHLQEKLNMASTQIIKMKVTNDTIISQYNEKMKEAENIIQEQKNEIFELQRRGEKLESDIRCELRYREDLINKVNVTREVCRTLETHVNVLTSIFNTCQQDVCTLENSYKHASTVIADIKTRQANYKTELNNLQSLLTSERQIKEEMCINWKVMQNSLEEVTKQFKDQLKLKECEINKMNQEIKQYNEKFLETKFCNENLLKQINKNIDCINEKEKLLISTQTQLCIIKEDASLTNTKFVESMKKKDEEIFSLKNNLESIKSHHNKLIEELNNSKISINEELSLKKEKIEHLENQLKITITANDEYTESENKLKEIISHQKKQNYELELSTEGLKQENSDLKNKLVELDLKKCQNTELWLNEKNVLINENEINIKKNFELELEFKNMQNKYELEKETLHKEIDILKQNLDNKNSQIQSCMERINSLQKAVDVTAKENTLLKEDIIIYQSNVCSRNDKITELKNEIDKLKNEANMSQSDVFNDTQKNISRQFFKGTETGVAQERETLLHSKENYKYMDTNAYDAFEMSDSSFDDYALNSPHRKGKYGTKKRMSPKRKLIFDIDAIDKDKDKTNEFTKPKKCYRRQTKSVPNK